MIWPNCIKRQAASATSHGSVTKGWVPKYKRWLRVLTASVALVGAGMIVGGYLIANVRTIGPVLLDSSLCGLWLFDEANRPDLSPQASLNDLAKKREPPSMQKLITINIHDFIPDDAASSIRTGSRTENKKTAMMGIQSLRTHALSRTTSAFSTRQSRSERHILTQVYSESTVARRTNSSGQFHALLFGWTILTYRIRLRTELWCISTTMGESQEETLM